MTDMSICPRKGLAWYKKHSPAYIINYILLILLAIITFYPFWYVVVMSFSTNLEVQNINFLLWPKGFTLDNIKYIFATEHFGKIYLNTFFVVVVGTILSMTCTIFYAYPIYKKVPGARFFSFMAFFTLIFSGGIIPTYAVVRATGLINSLWSVILPVTLDPFFVFLMINYLKTVPHSLVESAEIDGAGVLRTLWQIMLPVSMTGLATITLFYAVGYFNAYFNAMIYLTDRENWTLQLLLREILISTQAGSGGVSGISSAARLGKTLKMATILTAVVPVMLIYPFVQRYFVHGVMVGAVKG